MITLETLLCLAGFIFGGFTVSRILRRNDVADFFWGLGFVSLAVVHSVQSEHFGLRAKVVLGLVVFWGVRLALYTGFRMLGKKEDQRYANWRISWGKSEPLRAFFQVFLLQGTILGVIALPVIWVLRMDASEISGWDFLGLALVLTGLCFEVIADFQMRDFKKSSQNHGKIMSQGLWSYSRHPNYFGEILIWWGFFFMALNLPGAFLTLVSPLLITFLLLRVSGVTLLEMIMKEKGPAFEAYLKTTPTILPLSGRDILVFFIIIGVLVLLDALWLGVLMKDYYSAQLQTLGRIQGGNWDPVLWAAGGVYLAIALGVQFFAVRGAQGKWDAAFKGGILGLSMYAVYELTNISLVRNWPLGMAWVDVLWGVVLCSVAGLVGKLAYRDQKPQA